MARVDRNDWPIGREETENRQMNLEELKKVFRTPDPNESPELEDLTRADIYEGFMGPGGLYLATGFFADGYVVAVGPTVVTLTPPP